MLPRARFIIVGWLLLVAPMTPRAQTPQPPDPVQVQAPVFRAGTYVVPLSLSLTYRKQPWIGLAAADVMVVLDKASIAPLEMQHDDAAPSHYTVFFQPPDAARDGRAHVLQIKVRKPNAKDWTTLPFKTSLTLPKRESVSTLF
jgi:hypothetical protein